MMMVQINLKVEEPKPEGQAGMGSLQVNSSTPAGVCSLIFHDQCTALEKCRRFCSSVGASRYRWFHTACCECIGDTCISYGVNESLCRDCRPSQE
ncbi:hypothetical protein BSL78_28089 [Apostichopus japonicus]|uniref:Tsg C-terminal domain-containing protein n=1 Tax=Stichopus japonicus TaxID=307972 RepID=A0A2G8JH61_STIJA|nr:hypothetical protein BSL78_28089 [Apostichopus japonicus]